MISLQLRAVSEGFNEAEASLPRKYRQAFRNHINEQCFNEAEASLPRKFEGVNFGEAVAGPASMRPRQVYLGNNGDGTGGPCEILNASMRPRQVYLGNFILLASVSIGISASMRPRQVYLGNVQASPLQGQI